MEAVLHQRGDLGGRGGLDDEVFDLLGGEALGANGAVAGVGAEHDGVARGQVEAQTVVGEEGVDEVIDE